MVLHNIIEIDRHYCLFTCFSVNAVCCDRWQILEFVLRVLFSWVNVGYTTTCLLSEYYNDLIDRYYCLSFISTLCYKYYYHFVNVLSDRHYCLSPNSGYYDFCFHIGWFVHLRICAYILMHVYAEFKFDWGGGLA